MIKLKRIIAVLIGILTLSGACFAVACSNGGENSGDGGNNPPPEQPDENPDEEPDEKPEREYPYYVSKPVKETEEYVELGVYIENEEINKIMYGIEIKPVSASAQAKVPVIIYVHGFDGNALTLVEQYEPLAEYGIAGFAIECCGGNKVSPNSQGMDIYPSHYTSRISDLEAALNFVKTLDYVDTSRIYINGQSYGGLVCMMDAPRHPEVRGMILQSTGLGEDGGMLLNEGKPTKGRLEKYAVPEDWQSYMKEYEGDVIILHSQGDTTVTSEVAAYTEQIYAQRENGRVKLYSYEGGDHSFNMFTPEAKAAAIEAIRSFVLDDTLI